MTDARIVISLVLGTAILTVGAYRFFRSTLRRRLEAAARRAVRRFEVRLNRYKLVDRHRVRDELLADSVVQAALAAHANTHDTPIEDVEKTVREYVHEIVPFFNVLSYYKVGYNLSRMFIRMLYRVNVRFRDEGVMGKIPRGDVVVYTMNHRSNADYVVVAYVLAGRVSISYAVGEWARVWPLEYVFKSFGSYFVRRRFRDPLYHTVLERYVQLITRNGVTQGIFLEGGLTRDGLLRPPKLGLLDYIARTLADPAFGHDIWLVPVALNYDRVLEDRTLSRELSDQSDRPGKIRQATSVTRFFFLNLVRALTGNLKRYGRVGVTFGKPVSIGSWANARPGVLRLDKEHRLPELEKLADGIMRSIGQIMPVTPVPLTAAVLLSFGRPTVSESELRERLRLARHFLIESESEIEPELGADAILDRAWIMLGMRRLVERNDNHYTIPDAQRPLLKYYANSVQHLLPESLFS